MTFQNIQQAYTNNTGTTPTSWPIVRPQNPTVNDVNYKIGQFWINSGPTKELWYLAAQNNQVTASNPYGLLQSTWELISINSALVSLSDTGNANVVFPSLSSDTPPDNIQFIGGTGISIVGDNVLHTMTITNTGSSQTFIPDTGISPVSGSAIIFSNTTILATGTLTNALRSNGTGASTISYQTQYAGSNASSSAASKWGVAQFDSTQFTVTSGFVQLAGGVTPPTLGFIPDADTAPGTSPVTPNGSGNVILEGGALFNTGTQANPIRTNSLAANTIDFQIQRAGSNAAVLTANNFGVAQFDANQFTVTSGFVKVKNSGITGVVTNLVGDDTLSVVPASGTGAITLDGLVVANATHAKPVFFAKNATSTEELDIQRTTVVSTGAKTVNNVGLASFDSAVFTVDSATGWISLVGGSLPVALTLTGNTGLAVGPNGSGNINTVGTGSITVAGNPGTNTLTAQLTGLTNHNVLVGAGTATVGLITPGTTNQVLTSNGASADPTFQSLSAIGAVIQFTLDVTTTPIMPSAGNITITGGQVATGVVGTNVIRTRGNTASSCTIEIQRTTVAVASDPTLNGVSHFNSAQFTVGTNGFVSLVSAPTFTWTDEAVSFNASSNNGYFITAAAVIGTLPASPNQGDVVRFASDTANTFQITAGAGQRIRLGNVQSAIAGTAVSTRQGDTINLVYRAADNTWFSMSSVGSWTVT